MLSTTGAMIAPMLMNAGQATLLTIIAIVIFFLYLEWRVAQRAKAKEEALAARQAAAGEPVTPPKPHRTFLGGIIAVAGWVWTAAFGPPLGQEPKYDPERDPDDLDWDNDGDGPPRSGSGY